MISRGKISQSNFLVADVTLRVQTEAKIFGRAIARRGIQLFRE
jgi:hypothetical protein